MPSTVTATIIAIIAAFRATNARLRSEAEERGADAHGQLAFDGHSVAIGRADHDQDRGADNREQNSRSEIGLGRA